MSRLPKNVFDSPFKNTATAALQAREEGRAPAHLQALPPTAAETPPEPVSPAPAPTTKPAMRKHTVYLTDDQVLGLNERIFRMRAQGKTARDANITKVIALAVDHYLAHAD